ncbi:ABC transporter substrate-binding protein [Leucobacter sp. GX24907]
MTRTLVRRSLSIGAISALTVFGLAACANSSDEAGTDPDCTTDYDFETVEPGKLIVAAYDFPPLSIIEGDSMSGLEGDLLQEVADRTCLELVIDAAGGANASIPSVQTGRADLAAADWYRTTARGEIVRLSTPVYLDQSAVISTQGLTADDLEGKRIASVVGNLWNDSVQKWLGDDFTVYQDDESIYSDLEAGRIDAIIASIPTATLRLEDSPIDGVTLEPLTPRPEVPEFEKPGQANWPTSFDNEALREALDEIIADMHDDGTIVEVLEKWNLDAELADVGDPYEL